MTAILYLGYSIYRRQLVEPMDFLDWLCSLRFLWTIFFAVTGGFFLASYTITNEPLFIGVIVISITALIAIKIGYTPPPEPIANTITIEKEVEQVIEKAVIMRPNRKRYGVIYVMRRADGILKFGKTKNLRGRIRGHRRDYKTSFNVLTSWVVPDTTKYENLALQMTSKYHFSEAGHRELRQMSDMELEKFIFNFTEEVQNGFNQKH